MAETVLSKLAIQISAQTAQFQAGLKSAQSQFTSFTSNITKAAGAIGLAFGTQAIASFALEVAKLSGEAEAVRIAFERLPQSVKLMNELKKATGETVSELDLMKRSVQAANFGISLQALPKLLEFATLRAQQTGQSVDYLVDSIVTGIGRKSKLILDNLGISAVQLDEALGGVSTAAASIGDVADAVGKIAEDNLKNMAGFSDNASTKLQKLSASWENLKVAIGDAANSNGIFGSSIDALGEQMENLASKDLTGFEKFLSVFGGASGKLEADVQKFVRGQKAMFEETKKNEQVIREVDRAFAEFGGNIDAYGKAITTHIYRTELLAEFQKRLVTQNVKQIETYDSLKEKLAELNSSFDSLDTSNKKELANTGQQIIAINKKIEALDRLRKAQEGVARVQASPDASKFISGLDLSSTLIADSKVTGGDVGSSLSQFTIPKVNGEEFIKSLNKIRDTRDDFVSETEQTFVDFSGIISGGISEMAYAFGQAAAGVGNFGDAILKALVGFARQMGEILIGAGVAMLAAKKLITNPYTAIAAGVALVAIAGAASAALSSSQSGFNSGGGGGGSSPSTGSGLNQRVSDIDGIRIQFDATFVQKGNDLVAVVNKTNKENGRLRGG